MIHILRILTFNLAVIYNPTINPQTKNSNWLSFVVALLL